MTGIELLVGGWFASPVIRRVLDKALKYVGGNYELNKNTEELIDTLADKLALCQATIKVAERRMINHDHLADLLNKLKKVVYDAEDVLDDMEAKSIQDQVEGKNKVSKFASSSLSGITNLILPDDLHKSLKKVVDKLNTLYDENKSFLEFLNMSIKDESNDHELSGQRETTSRPVEKMKLYHRQQEYLNLILEMILHPKTESSKKKEQNYNNRGLLVIPIVGMGGIGKTALAQVIYNNSEVQQTFQPINGYKVIRWCFRYKLSTKAAWISVSYNLDIKLVMRQLIQSLGGSLSSDVITLEDISNNLSSLIDRERILVVLDDMCEKIDNQWDILYTILSTAGPGSVVLITTQNQTFANRVGTFGPLMLNPLEPETMWEILKNFVFGSVDNISEEKQNNLEITGQQIAHKLHGLPLAAKIIGNLLRCNINILEENLQKNSLIEKNRLIQMWIAQNFIHHNSNDTRKMEDIGREWFDKLVEMSFFQHAEDYNGYVIPNLMHDLALIVSSNECFYLTDHSNEIPQSVRHLAVDTKSLNVLQKIPKRNHIRSFFYFGFPHVDGMPSTINKIICNMESIRVLDLSYLLMETTKPPKAIENMAHLRFLDLSLTGIKELSQSFPNDHYHLQSLYIQQSSLVGESELVKLPKGINKLINLRHLIADADTIAQISGIGQLVNLQELDEYRVGETEGNKITELKNLRELSGRLTIMNCENVRSKEEAEQARLAEKKNLNSVELSWSDVHRESNIDKDILEGLKPYEGITGLTICCYMGLSFPDWIIDSSLLLNLQNIYLDTCTNLKVLPPLGQLPSLKRLHLSDLASIEMIDHCLYGIKKTAFPALTHFISSDLTSCGECTKPTWVSRFFPHLSTLEICKNNALRKVPLHSFSASLTALKIKDCHNLNSLTESLHHLTSLNLLHVNDCKMSVSIDTNALMLLEDLMLGNCPLLCIKGDVKSLTKLKRLLIRSCPKLLSNSMHDITNKQKGKNLEVNQAKGLRSLFALSMDKSLLHNDYHLILGRLPSLRFLHCEGSKQRQFTMNQTLWFQELTSLQELTFSNCNFTQLPSSLVTLPSLRNVKLISCYVLQSLPENCMPPSLLDLDLEGCSDNLVRRCQPGGEDWSHIAMVQVIRIDGKVIGQP